MDTVINSSFLSITCKKEDVHCQTAEVELRNTPNENSNDVPLLNSFEDGSVGIFQITPEITVEEAVAHFKSLKLPKDFSRLPPEGVRFSQLLKFFKPPPKLQEPLSGELDFILAVAQSSLNWSDLAQCRMLQTLYKKLTGAEFDCPLRGSHWQIIGFQGNDPARDLRGVGLFGLLQFLYLTSDKMYHLGQKLFIVANSDNQPFPLAVLSLNITNIVLNVMTSGKLNRECNLRKSVLDVLNSFYAALMVYVLNAWISGNKTIKDSGYLLKEAERYCSRNVRRVLRDLPQNLLKYQQ